MLRQSHKVLDPVVVADSVDVMNVFVISQGTPEVLFNH